MSNSREVALAAGTEVQLTSLRTRRKVLCTVSKLIGVGGTAKVYAGTLEDGAHVVLKTQRTDGRGADAVLEVEVELFKKLFHRNIVHCVGVGVTPAGHLTLGFRRAYSNPLLLLTAEADELRRDKRARYPSLPIDTAIDLSYELLNALAYLERLGFVHHDVKLGNLLIDVDPKDGRPLEGGEVFGRVATRAYRGVLIDFGATRSRNYLEAWNRGETAEGLAPQITPFYAPPEAVVETRRADGSLGFTFDPTLDVYAAALVIYAAFTGHPPYSHVKQHVDPRDLESMIGIKSSERRGDLEPIAHEILQRVVYEDAKLNMDRAEFDLALYRFLAKRLHPDPKERGTAAAMKRDFERLCRIRSAQGSDTEHRLATGGSRVFLPFTQELVRVAPTGEHPLLRAARLAGLDEAMPEPASEPPPAEEPPPEPRPSGRADWARATRETPIAVEEDLSFLEDMDATGESGGASPLRGPAPSGFPPAGPPVRPPTPPIPSQRRRPPPPPRPRQGASGKATASFSRLPDPHSGPPVRPLTPPPARPPARPETLIARAPGAPLGPGPLPATDDLLRRAGVRRRGERRRHTAAREGAGAGGNPLERRDPSREQAEAPHCLLSPVLDTPLLLSRDHPYRVGRDPAVDVRIKSDLVSRRHAEILWGGRGFVLKDLGSLNGTTLNGVRLQAPVVLHDQDRIGFGGFEFVVRVLVGDEYRVEQGGGTTRILQGGVDWGAGHTPAFAGNLGQLGLKDVVEIIDWKRHSGTLAISPASGSNGYVYFEEGRLVHAESKGASGLEAALDLLGVKQGRYSFKHGRPRCPTSIQADLDAIWAAVNQRAGG